MKRVSGGSHGRILVVDDEVSLLCLMEQFLRRLGYEVDSCSNAEEAFRRFEAEPETYSLVVTDILMPGLSGKQMVLRLLERNPKIAVVVCSGTPFTVSTLPPDVQRQVAYVQKPFTPSMLAEAVQRLMGGAAAASAG